MAPRRTLQEVLVMRNSQQKARDLRHAKEAAIRNVLSNTASIAQRMSIETYHCRYSKHFFDKKNGERIFPTNLENIQRFWMFHKPYGCDQKSSLNATLAPPVNSFVDSYSRKEHAHGKYHGQSVRLIYDLQKNYSGIVLCQWIPDKFMTDEKSSISEYSIGDNFTPDIEVLFHCVYPYIPELHDALLHKRHHIDIPLDNQISRQDQSPQATVKIDSLGRGTDSLLYWHAARKSTSKTDVERSHNRFMLVEVSTPIIGKKSPCIPSLLEPLLRVDVLKYPRTMVHAAKLTAELLDDRKAVQMISSTIRPHSNFEYNRVPSFPKFYITEKSLSDDSGKI